MDANETDTNSSKVTCNLDCSRAVVKPHVFPREKLAAKLLLEDCTEEKVRTDPKVSTLLKNEKQIISFEWRENIEAFKMRRKKRIIWVKLPGFFSVV